MQILGLLMFIAIVGDLVLSSLWVPFYFMHGIPLYRRSMPYDSESISQIDFTAISSIAKRPLSHTMLFHKIGKNCVAFREKMFGFTMFSYGPMMHGLIKHDEKGRKITITGYVNWILFAVPLIFILSYQDGFFEGNELFLKMSIYLAVGGSIFSHVAQTLHYNRIYAALKELRKDIRSVNVNTIRG